MSSVRTIEEYVDEIKLSIMKSNYDKLGEVYDTLQRMKGSAKSKHELNYWRVMQCLGEVTVDTIVKCIINIEKISCKCHINSNLQSMMFLFLDVLCNVAVIKRVLNFKISLGPLFFRAIRQTDEQALSKLGFEAMHRCVIVGKTEVAEFYMKYGLMKDIYKEIKVRHDREEFNYIAIMNVTCCTKLLLIIGECGTDYLKKQVRRSLALRILGEYIVKLRTNKIVRHGVQQLISSFTHLKNVVTDDKLAEKAFEAWNTKDRLCAELEQDEIYLFCSSPSCRKMCGELEKFRYCGACRLTRYCSEDCQKEHWKMKHKSTCLHHAVANDK